MFVRAGAPATPAAGPGTRPGPGGTPVLSTGVAGLDAALRGGAPLGRVVLLESDAGAARVADALVRLFVAEGVACGHAVTWGAAGVDGGDGDGWRLPGERAGRGETARRGGAAPAPSSAAPDLKIAWQYRRYIAAAKADADAGAGGGVRPSPRRAPPRAPGASAGALPAWCHDFDLNARVDPPASVVRVGGCGRAAAAAAVDAAVDAARAARGADAPPARVVVSLPSSPAWMGGGRDDDAAAASIVALRRLRGAARRARVSVVALAPPGALPSPASRAAAAAAADAVLVLAPLRSDGPGAALLAGRADAVGLLTLTAPPRNGAGYARPPPSAPLYVVTRRGGRLSVREADVDPELVEGGGGGGSVCGGGAGGVVDF